jgi:hypothetical protein
MEGWLSDDCGKPAGPSSRLVPAEPTFSELRPYITCNDAPHDFHFEHQAFPQERRKMQIYIHRNNEDFGPYSREAVLEYLKQGIFNTYDHACYAGMSEWKTVSDLLGIGVAPEPVKVSKFQGASPKSKASSTMPTTNAIPRQQGRVRRMHGSTGEKKRGAMIALNLVLVGLVAAGIYIRMGGGGEKGRRILAAVSALFSKPAPESNEENAAAAPAVAAPAPPAIEKAPAAPTPAPVAAATPAPPKPFDPADLAGNPSAWPKTVRLLQATNFPAVFNSQVVGSVTLPAGSEVKLVNIQGDQLTLDHQGGTQTLSWKLTDLEQEVAKGGSAASAAPTATPATDAAVTATTVPPGGN